jgi:hexosaminidase
MKYHIIFFSTLKYPLAILIISLSCLNSLKAQPTAATAGQFAVKGFHLDLRIQVMKMPALKALALKLSKGGVNTLIMEWEGTYPYKDHLAIPNRFAYTREEVISFIDYCTSLGIDVIPLQQSFGHVEYILQNYRYDTLREDKKDYSQINPIHEKEAKEFFTGLYKDLISTHKSPYFHIGGDETYLLGHSEESKKKIAQVGIARLYGDYIKMLCEIVTGLGKRPVLWADIALKYPEALKNLPPDIVLVDWNYGWDLNHFGDHKKLMDQGFEVWGAPAIRSDPDNYFVTDWAKHFKNIKEFVPQSVDLGYKGIVMTSWSTSGVYSPVFETVTDITFLHALRHVYPITGFNILIDAYLKSLKDPQNFNPHQFITQYAAETYGLSASGSKLFYNALTSKPFLVKQGKVAPGGFTIDQILDSAMQVANTFKTLKPRTNKNEFAHYVLMADIRVQYLKYEKAEIWVNSPDFTEAQVPQVLALLNSLDTRSIDKRFIALNKNVFYKPELEEENMLRNKKIINLYNRLARKRD